MSKASKQMPASLKAVADSVAHAHRTDFTTFGFDLNGGLGIWFFKEQMKNFFGAAENSIGVFEETIQRIKDQKPTNPPKSAIWVVGFYWAIKPGADGKKKMNFYIVPTIYDAAKNEVYDYFDEKYYKYYHSKTKNSHRI